MLRLSLGFRLLEEVLDEGLFVLTCRLDWGCGLRLLAAAHREVGEPENGAQGSNRQDMGSDLLASNCIVRDHFGGLGGGVGDGRVVWRCRWWV